MSGVADAKDSANDDADEGVLGADISNEALLPTLEDNVSKHGFNRICMIAIVIMELGGAHRFDGFSMGH